MPVYKKKKKSDENEKQGTWTHINKMLQEMWWYCFSPQSECRSISVVLVGILFYAGSHDFSFHSFLTCVLPSQSLWISLSSGPTVKFLSFFISSSCSVYASDFLPSSASPCPSVDSKARPAGFRMLPSKSPETLFLLLSLGLSAGREQGGAGVWGGGPQIGHALCVSLGQGLRGPASAVNHDSKRCWRLFPSIIQKTNQKNRSVWCPKLQKKLLWNSDLQFVG